MPERFDPAPRWARRVLWTLGLTAYTLTAILAVIVITWPASELTAAQVAFGRIGGVVALIAAVACVASYPWHLWRLEMHGAWGLGIALTIVTAAVAHVDYSASRGMLVTALMVVVIAVYVRAVSLVVFGIQTTGVALRVKRLGNGRRPLPHG